MAAASRKAIEMPTMTGACVSASRAGFSPELAFCLFVFVWVFPNRNQQTDHAKP